MIRLIRNILLLVLLISSLFIINYLKSIIITNNVIYQEIINNKDDFEIKPIEAQIINNKYFIPGVSGRKVNVAKSFDYMKKSGYYNSNHFIYDEINPSLKIKDNKLPILKGNSYYRSIAIITLYQANNMTSYKDYNQFPYIINVTYLNKNNYLTVKNNVEYGDILYLNNDLTYQDIIYLINYFNQKGFKIIPLNDLLSE